jgi:hypothetical protein
MNVSPTNDEVQGSLAQPLPAARIANAEPGRDEAVDDMKVAQASRITEDAVLEPAAGDQPVASAKKRKAWKKPEVRNYMLACCRYEIRREEFASECDALP